MFGRPCCSRLVKANLRHTRKGQPAIKDDRKYRSYNVSQSRAHNTQTTHKDEKQIGRNVYGAGHHKEDKRAPRISHRTQNRSGAGSLYVSPKHTLAVSDTPDFPDTFKPLAAAMAKALGKLRERSNVKWTYISPAGYFRAEGKRTGPYILGGEELTLADAGESVISYADYAIAMIDEIETGNHLQQRVSTERKQHNIVKCSSKSGNALPLDTASLTR